MHKYLKITGSDMYWATDELKKDDLIRLQEGSYNHIINLEDQTYFSVETNSWNKFSHN